MGGVTCEARGFQDWLKPSGGWERQDRIWHTHTLLLILHHVKIREMQEAVNLAECSHTRILVQKERRKLTGLHDSSVRYTQAGHTS